MPSVNTPQLPTPLHSTTACLASIWRATALLGLATVLGACTSTSGPGDPLDYKSRAVKTTPLDVPPDLTQLQRDSRAAIQADGGVSASTYQAAIATAPVESGGGTVAPTHMGDMRIVRAGSQRWLEVPLPADKLWPLLRAFWQERGLKLVIDDAATGVMQTEWAENRANIPQDLLRRTIGRVFDALYDSGERDRFRLRVERNDRGSEIYLSHQGMVEVYTAKDKDQTRWTPRASDPQLEAEMLTRLMIKLGVQEAPARAMLAQPTTEAPRARTLSNQAAATLRMDDGFDRAWRRVGLALDRSGFTVEDRDRAGGIYFVRYIDPQATSNEPGFFAKLFSNPQVEAARQENRDRYRIAVKADGDQHTTVAVLNAQGEPENGEVAQRILALLVADLK